MGEKELKERVAQWLDLRLVSGMSGRAGEKLRFSGGDVLRWERQVKFDLYALGRHRGKLDGFEYDYWTEEKVGTYTIDFKVEYTDGRIEYLEVKGMWTPLAKLKWKIFRANHPELTVRIITEKELPRGF